VRQRNAWLQRNVGRADAAVGEIDNCKQTAVSTVGTFVLRGSFANPLELIIIRALFKIFPSARRRFARDAARPSNILNIRPFAACNFIGEEVKTACSCINETEPHPP